MRPAQVVGVRKKEAMYGLAKGCIIYALVVNRLDNK